MRVKCISEFPDDSQIVQLGEGFSRNQLLAKDLTDVEADGLEQVFIEGHGGASGYSNGGSLINKINNISPNNSYYSTATNAANKILFK